MELFFHYLCTRFAFKYELFHPLHCALSVGVEEFVSLTKVVLSPLARVVLYKSMLWTLAVAEPVEFAMSALVRK